MTAFSPYPTHPGASPEYQDGPPPVLVAVAGPAPQRRLTVGVRLILLVPHLIVLYFLMLAASVVAFIGWWGALFTGRLPLWAGSFLAGILGWMARVSGYGLLLTDAYPPFTFDDDRTYPVRLALPEPQRLNRAAVFFRIILVIPAGLVGTVIAYGAGTLMSFIAWLITLVAGRLPASLHEAFTAVVRYEVRYYAYWLMLTPAYPGGLYGDKTAVPAWADQPGAAPGFGTAESVYGTAPGGYGAPYSPHEAPGAAQVPDAYAYPVAPGYPAPASYGTKPVFQPATWNLLLTSGAKKLVTTIIVLGAVIWVAEIGLQVARVHSATNAVVASNAIAALNTSYGTLSSQVTARENALNACQNQTCATRQDARAAAEFAVFASRLQAIPLPASAASAAARLDADATAAARDFTAVSKTTTASQYQSTITSSGLDKVLNRFSTDYSALGQELDSSRSGF
ncbi:MAG: DUF4389 domain-containing protein [Trebonia sp.]|jgi:hypothetical protein